jgi:hypothetical protein
LVADQVLAGEESDSSAGVDERRMLGTQGEPPNGAEGGCGVNCDPDADPLRRRPG